MSAQLQDLLPPFDPTAYISITSAQLLQLITGTTPNNGIGMCLVTTDSAGAAVVPDASTYTKWQAYIWIRISASAVTVYVWNPYVSDVTYKGWVTLTSSSIAPGTIVTSMIAAGAITSSLISSCSASVLTGSLPSYMLAVAAASSYSSNGLMQNTSPMFGQLNGTGSTVGAPVIGNAAVVLANMAAQSVAGNQSVGVGNIVDYSVTSTQLKNNGLSATGNSYLAFQAAIDLAYNISTPSKGLIGTPSSTNFDITNVTYNTTVLPGDVVVVNSKNGGGLGGLVTTRKAILTLAEPSSPAIPQVPLVAAGQSAYALANAQGANGGTPLGRILQQVVITDSTPYTAQYGGTSGTYSSNVSTGPSTSHAATNAIPSWGSNSSGISTNTVMQTPLVCVFQPLQGLTSTIVVEVDMQLSNNQAGDTEVAALFMNPATTATNAVAANGVYIKDINAIATVRLLYKTTPASTNPITFQACHGSTNNYSYYNNVSNGTTALFGGVVVSSMKITEYI